MYKNAGETSRFFAECEPLIAGVSGVEMVVCAPFVNIPAAVEAARGSRIQVGAQDVFWLKEGAYTGEVSGAHARLHRLPVGDHRP